MTNLDLNPKCAHEGAEMAEDRHLDDDTLLDALLEASDHVDYNGLGATSAEDVKALVKEFVDFEVLTSDSESNVRWAFIAHLLARAVIDYGPNPAHVVYAGLRLERAPRQAIDSWLDKVLALIRQGTDNSRLRWRDALGREPSRVHPVIPAGRVRVARTEAEWVLCDSLQLWSEATMGFLDRGLWAPLALLQRWDINEWFNAIDQWSDPRFVHSALLFAEERVSANDLFRLLACARPCFNDAGAPTQAAGAVVLCQVIQAAARGLHAEGSENSRLHFERMSSELLQRTDGIPLSLALAADLTDRVVSGADSRVESHVRTFWEVLLNALALRHIPLQSQREYFTQRCPEPSGRWGGVRRVRPALFVAAKVLDRGRLGEVEAYISWLVDALLSEERWGIWASTVNDLVPVLASPFVGADQPRTRCRSVYVALEAQRRRAQHRHSEAELDFPSELILLVLAYLCEAGSAQGLEKDLEFGTVQAFRIGLTSGSATQPTVTPWEVTAIFLAIGCFKFGLCDPRAVELVRPLVADTKVWGTSCGG